MKNKIAAAVAMLAFAAPAFAELVEIKWSPDGAASQEFTVAPGKFAEWCGKLRKGEKVTWRYEAAAPLDFNVHYHEGKDVRFPAKHDGAAKAEGTLDVGVDHDYCWMWTNKAAAPVTLKAVLGKPR